MSKSKTALFAALVALFAAGLSAQDFVQRKMHIEKPSYPAAPAMAELAYQMALASAAENGGVELVAAKDEADVLLAFAIEAASGGRAVIRVKTWDKLAYAGRDDIVPMEKTYALTSLETAQLYEAFALPLGRWIATEFPLVEPRIREVVKIKVVKETKTIDLSKGVGLLVKSEPGATLTLFDGRTFVFDANGIVKIEGIPQNSTVRLEVRKEGYYTESATVVVGKADEKLLVLLDPIDRFHVSLESLGPMGFIPSFSWEAVPDLVTIGFVPMTNVEYVYWFNSSYPPKPKLFFAQPELFVMYRLGSQANPVWFDLGLGTWMRFDIQGSYPYDMALSRYSPWGLRLRFTASGRIAEGWSLCLTWQPTIYYDETYVSDLMSSISGKPKFEASEAFNYADEHDWIFFDPEFPYFLSLFEFMGGVMFSF